VTPFPLPRKLEALYFSNLNLQYDIKKYEIVNNRVLSHLDLSANGIKGFYGPVYGVPSLRHLDLSRNYCFYVHPLFFSEMLSLRTLLLYNNKLGRSFAKDEEGITFSALALLEILDLSSNVIEDLPKATFKNNANLHLLNLSNNGLSQFQPTLVNQTNLQTLDLSYNFLKCFSKTT
ncbi:hypothetical protein EGW08_018234, partial [Elysia chlorotica]